MVAPHSSDYYFNHFKDQSGHGSTSIQYDGIGTVFRSQKGLRGFGQLRYQHGMGFGSFIQGILKKAIPFLKNTLFPAVAPAINEVKQSIQDAAANVVEDVIQGENIGESIKRNVTSEGKKLLTKAPQVLAGILTRNKPETPVSQTRSDKQSTSSAKRRKRVTFKIPPKKRKGTSSKKFPGLAHF